MSFEEQLAGIRERLAELHEQQEDWSKAAHVLAGMDLETGVTHLVATIQPLCKLLSRIAATGARV